MAKPKKTPKPPSGPVPDLLRQFVEGMAANGMLDGLMDKIVGEAAEEPAPTLPEQPADPAVYELKVTLLDVRPTVWRRVRVGNELTLAQMHEVLQIAMPWTNSHLHQFFVDEAAFTAPDPDGVCRGNDERRYRLLDFAFQPKERFFYEYDFGDSWIHELVLEKVLPPEPDFVPVCMKGMRACPPDDCGGFPGYANLLKALRDPAHPEHEELREWAGDFDPERFDLEAVNADLRALARRWHRPLRKRLR